ncbi:lytic murein transglycosylase [Nordella sp. HKS 07]|uniref:lytic murein transglycosylase n=1 Tax=Nordella sp. HKS 07 TaxID=2712222 RepID=UPI0013E1FEAF|nr:lytic murein transglycosylase [Nordella sp. HKS 07]QIG51377.1 lytic murein transglycosylase [Nordella sp. HKS 07]
MKLLPLCLSASLLIASSAAASAATDCPSPSKFPSWLSGVKKEAAGMGISKGSIAVLDGMTYDPAVIKRDRAQSVFSLAFLDFQARLISAGRMNTGSSLLNKHGAIFQKVEQKYGVPPAVIVAFWGLETDFGGYMGDFHTIRSLATLSFDCRRPEKFRPQLFAALQILDRGDMTEADMVGAWAGEIGQVQFLPADFLQSGVDADGDGRVDLKRSIPDILYSAANLLINHGWQPNQPWLQEVRVPEDLPWDQADIAIQHPRSQWAKWGVKLVSGKALKADKAPASLLLPMGRHGPAFLAYPNFTEVYLKWNESLIYSTTAAYFATRLAGAPPVSKGNGPIDSLDYNQIMELQKILTRMGYDVGKVDGKLGAQSRAAVKSVQIKLGLPADSWPTPDLLERLRRS